MSEQDGPQRVELEEYTGEIHKPYLFNYADGIDGHYCIARKAINGRYEFWDNDSWILDPDGDPDITGHIFDNCEVAVSKLYHLRRVAIDAHMEPVYAWDQKGECHVNDKSVESLMNEALRRANKAGIKFDLRFKYPDGGTLHTWHSDFDALRAEL
jgi:hypothetical protein